MFCFPERSAGPSFSSRPSQQEANWKHQHTITKLIVLSATVFFFFSFGLLPSISVTSESELLPEPACRCYVSLCWWGFSSIVWKAWPRGFYCWISVVRMSQTFGEKWGQCNHKETQPFTLRVWRKIYFWRLHLWMLTRQFFFFFLPTFLFSKIPTRCLSDLRYPSADVLLINIERHLPPSS